MPFPMSVTTTSLKTDEKTHLLVEALGKSEESKHASVWCLAIYPQSPRSPELYMVRAHHTVPLLLGPGPVYPARSSHSPRTTVKRLEIKAAQLAPSQSKL